jgi:hypothetical protein
MAARRLGSRGSTLSAALPAAALPAAALATVLAALPLVGSPQGLVRPGVSAPDSAMTPDFIFRIHGKDGRIQYVHVSQNVANDTEDPPTIGKSEQFRNIVTSRGSDGSWIIDATLQGDTDTFAWQNGIFFEL